MLAALMAILTVNCSAESKGSWLSDYGIDPNNKASIDQARKHTYELLSNAK